MNENDNLNFDNSENDSDEYTPKLFSEEEQAHITNGQIETNDTQTENLDFE